MTDLKDMIDGTTERLLKKIEDWEIPQSDKKFITVEKEVYESVLRVNCNKIAECERLQKQLDIAIKCLEIYALENLVVVSKDGSFTMEFKNGSYSRAKQALKEIEELNEIHKQE